MRHPRSGMGAELAPLVLILACLAGSLALIVTVHRRATAPKPLKPPVVALAPSPPEPQAPRPIPTPAVEEPEPPPAPAPEDPTPKAIARLTSAEAEQLLEASRADRKAASLEVARKAALLESEKWRRRESLVRLQLDSLDSKVRKMETEVDALALERDALEKERDARKALASQARSRPGQAILPHRGQNGTWRRPIVIECSNGMAILRPQGVGFGLLDLASGFGPGSNPFVATVAQEAIRIQGNASPDGQQVTPYIFFLVRPDGIRAYYEARGRLEPLGITFGYELADQDWDVDFPDLDDVKTWDGSPSARPDPLDSLAQGAARVPGGSPAEDEDFPSWGANRGARTPARQDGPGGDFTWPPRSRALQGSGGRVSSDGSRGPSSPRSDLRPRGGSGEYQLGTADAPSGIDPMGGSSPGGPEGPSKAPGSVAGLPTLEPGTGTSPEAAPGDPSNPAAPRELSLGGGPIKPLEPAGPSNPGRPSGPSAPRRGNPAAGPVARGSDPSATDPAANPGDASASTRAGGQDDPANTFVWPPKAGSRANPAGPESADSVDRSPPVRHVGPFSRPLAMGIDSAASPGSSNSPAASEEADPTQPDGPANANAATPRGSTARPSGSAGSGTGTGTGSGSSPTSTARGIGQGGTPATSPPPGSIGVGMPGMPQDGTPPASGGTPPQADPSGRKSPGLALPELPPSSIVDRRFEVVLVCGPKGVIVQPGTYRVTADALKDRDGLLKKEIVALVKAKRAADPKTTYDPRVRFLVLPGGEKNYWTARSQFLLSGLNWPISTQVADPDHLTILPSESW